MPLEDYTKRVYVAFVDILGAESSASGEIDTSTATPPVVILTPSSGKRISTRGVHIFSNSDAGEIEIRFQNSDVKVAKLYCGKRYHITLPEIHFLGQVDEPLVLDWDNLTSGAKIFYLIRYKEE